MLHISRGMLTALSAFPDSVAAYSSKPKAAFGEVSDDD